MLLASLFFTGCVHTPIPLSQEEGERVAFRDPSAYVAEAIGDDTAAPVVECGFALAANLYLDPAQELSFCAPDSGWTEGAGYEAGKEGIFFAYATFGTWVPGDGVIEGGEAEITVVGERGDWVAADLIAAWRAATTDAGYEAGEVDTVFVAGLEGYAFSAGIPAGTNESFPSGGTMIYFVADVPEGILTLFVGYGQYSTGNIPMYLSLTWDSVTAADITAL